MRRLLAQRDARLFLAGQSLSLLGDTALWLALGLWAKDLTGSSSAAGLVILCIVAPQLAAPFAGLLVDRVRRRTLLLAVNPLTALAVLPLLAVHDADDVWIIYAVALAYGASYTLLSAGQSALLHTLVAARPARPGQRRAADRPRGAAAGRAGRRRRALRARGRRGGRAARRRHVPRRHRRAARAEAARAEARPATPSRARSSPARATSARSPRCGRWSPACALCMLVIGFSETLLFELPHALGKPDSFVGVLMAVQGVGAIAGALTATRAIARHGELGAAGFGMTIFALGCLLMADSTLAVVFAGKLLFGLGLPWIVVAMLTLLQRSTPSHLQGRAFAATELALATPADAVDRARGGAGGPDRLPLCAAGPGLHGGCRRDLAAD